MVEARPAGPFPQRLLLATDLSARCDRALDRAAQLALQWGAELVALHVLDPSVSPDQTLAWIGGANQAELLQVAAQQLSRDLGQVNVPVAMRLGTGRDVADTVAETATRDHAGLVVTAVSQGGALRQFLLGSTVERLARSLSQPLLVVRKRSHGPYQRVLVASDFSPSSRHALQTAAQLFPGVELVVYHACMTTPVGLAGAVPTGAGNTEAAQRECAAFVASSALPGSVKVRCVIEEGAIETTLARYVRRHDIELVVMGSRGRGAVMSLLLGSTAARLLEWLPCDTLLVREPRVEG
ncbi:universal stress protein [uncultured Azohydromonas sp.]|jgi:Universal stress protein UspA and related nucleotide-binding proteins|uniref:universal stress protein n=1 Tax=uncultured Azohydromonas sp. TaxID=487342 RepID=UPI00261B0F0F|nr:universal stress protein [uncultured Azohydromonas sp.]